MSQHDAGHGHHDSHGSHDAHHVNYLYVFFALCGFTLMSIIADLFKDLSKPLIIVVVLSIASAKAISVMLYFMHLKFERNWKYVLLAPTIILAIGIPLALLPDIGLHYYFNDVPQTRRLAAEQVPDSEGELHKPSAAGHGH